MRRTVCPGGSGRGAAVLLVAVAALGLPFSARALDLNKRFTVGFRIGDYLPADEQKGGFRTFGSGVAGTTGEHAVQIAEVPVPTFAVAYGVGKVTPKVQFSLEVEVSRIDSEVGDETAYRDLNASTRVALPNPVTPGFSRRNDGDERFVSMPLGDIKMTPVIVHGLFHWSRDGGRVDFHAGAGLGVVLADLELSDEYVEFAGDTDGTPDVQVEDAMAVSLKLGSNVLLSRERNWLLYFEAQFISTGLLSSEAQVTWSGVDYFAGLQDVDTDRDNIIDSRGWLADYRLMDPGKLRMDGAIASVGIKYRFGGRKTVAPAPAEPAAAEETPQ